MPDDCKCPKCEGKGKIRCEGCTYEHLCPDCKGTGKLFQCKSNYDYMKEIIETNHVELILRFTDSKTGKITDYLISKDPFEIFAMQMAKFGLVMLNHFSKKYGQGVFNKDMKKKGEE